MKKLILIIFLCLSVNSFAQIGNLYIYNFSSLNVKYQLAAYNTNGSDCYPSYSFYQMPSSAGFEIAAGTQHVYNGFEFPTANFPTPPASGWLYIRDMGSSDVVTSPANAQMLSGNATSPYQARWKYFKWVTADGSQYGGLGFSSTCMGGISPVNETDDLILNMMTIGDDTVITIDNN